MAQDVKISAAEHCYRTLWRKIVSLELKRNEPIGEQALAQMLGVSRTPVREALSRLSAERFVDLRTRARVIIASIRLDAVLTAQFVREKLEVAIVSEAAVRPNRRFRSASSRQSRNSS
jgi:DNA-binding GntR family transcriptional regulator